MLTNQIPLKPESRRNASKITFSYFFVIPGANSRVTNYTTILYTDEQTVTDFVKITRKFILRFEAATYLCHLFAVSFGVKRRLGEQDRVLLGGDTELVVERVMPDLLHVVPVGDNAVLDGVLQRQDTSLALGLVSDVAVFLTHTDHNALQTANISLSVEQSDFHFIRCSATNLYATPTLPQIFLIITKRNTF